MFVVSLALAPSPFVLGFLPNDVGISYRIGSSELCPRAAAALAKSQYDRLSPFDSLQTLHTIPVLFSGDTVPTMMASFMSYFTGRRDSKQTARDAIVSLREQLMMVEKKEEHLQRQIAQDLTTAKANAVSNKAGTHSRFPSYELHFIQCRCFKLGIVHTHTAATAALRRKKMREADLDKLSGMRLQLEVQINTLESANINANTLDVMRRGATALKEIHNGLYVPPSLHLPEILSHTDRRRNFLSSLSRFGLVLISAGFSSDIDKVDATMNSINEQRDIANEIADAISNPANAGFQIDEVRTRGRGGGGRRRWLIGISMVCRRSSRPNSGNWSRRISTSDFWAQITYQYTPRRARAASKHDQQRCKRTKTQSCRHCKLHLRCLDGSFSLADPPCLVFCPFITFVI